MRVYATERSGALQHARRCTSRSFDVLTSGRRLRIMSPAALCLASRLLGPMPTDDRHWIERTGLLPDVPASFRSFPAIDDNIDAQKKQGTGTREGRTPTAKCDTISRRRTRQHTPWQSPKRGRHSRDTLRNKYTSLDARRDVTRFRPFRRFRLLLTSSGTAAAPCVPSRRPP